ncbi:uncharacterized protein LY89DRAFT_664829 [Mollisia scopiformis]|uniref:Uncharacterized protein n=1 Tax=Mollisia scopiformis TaxID=149040 RepID=A0A194XNA4_MOLSC|nr:uncharacterized protein LY89DRAFT_664829 [Mollisia scopiformis]KUJ21653.1 hypothetical protein LY89DRAFT_664829 [Mollisia scopiformis]
MRLTGTCWSCTVALAAVFFQGTWATELEKRADRRKKFNKDGKYRSNSWPKLAQKVVEGESSDDERYLRKSMAGQPVHGLAPTPRPTTTKSTATEVTAPRITEGPSLVRWKIGSMRWDVIQDGFLGQKRDADMCPSSYQPCPSSLGGGCCPSDGYSCGTSSCLPTSASPATACGFSGYIGCDIADGGGCCPANYICAAESCSPSPGISTSQACGVNSFQCPASLGGGCCLNGMGCALSACYNTNPITFTLVETFTTTEANSGTVTLTSTITSTTVSGAPDPTETIGVLVPKVQASASPIAKQQATSAASSGGGGLSTAALGGIIGGAIFFLSAILIAAIFIIRGLNRASKAQELANSRQSGSSDRRSRQSGQRRGTLNQDVDTMSIDPLMMRGSMTSGSFHRASNVSSPHNTIPEMEGSNSPPVFLSPFSPRSPPHTHYPKGYNPVVSSDSQYSQSSGGYRNPSLDSSPQMQHNPNGYFDLPVQHQNNNRISLISSQGRRPSHGRNYSNSSEVSQSSSLAAELDAGKDGSRKSSLQAESNERSSLQRFMTRLVRRRQSDPPALTGGPVRTDWTPSPREGLGYIAEAGESKLAVDHQNQNVEPPQTPFQDISLMDQPPGFRMS